MNIKMGIAERQKPMQVGGKVSKGIFTGEYTKAVAQLERGDTLTVLLHNPDKITLNRERQRLKYSCLAVERNFRRVFALRAEDRNLIVTRSL